MVSCPVIGRDYHTFLPNRAPVFLNQYSRFFFLLQNTDYFSTWFSYEGHIYHPQIRAMNMGNVGQLREDVEQLLQYKVERTIMYS